MHLAPFFAASTFISVQAQSTNLMSWTCGEACEDNPNFMPTLAGGVGNAVQFFFVGSKTTSTQLNGRMSELTNLNVPKGELNSTLFPNTPAVLEIHTHFCDEHAIIADEIRTEVQRLIAEKGATHVTVMSRLLSPVPPENDLGEKNQVGHSLGVPTSIGVNAVTYGTPPVGTADVVSFFDSQVTEFKRVNNENDLVPIVTGRFWGFFHPQGEIFRIRYWQIVACPGNDNADEGKCQIKTVPSVLSGNIIHHLGPYNGIFIGSVFCT
ncbi:hypothetical protein B0H19DRAFT_918419 [Mycena capillaripes]|nr:hypothetical protein B0H19DRAFT_918419 [Mycena capillaripes]